MTEPITKDQLEALKKLREPFPDNLINHRPVPMCERDEYKKLPKGTCKICGGYHALTKTAHLSYVGHAALTSRLLEVDPCWEWSPLALDEQGLPQFDATGGLWIKLTICGITRLGYGNAMPKPYSEIGSREKEVIGDAIRNGAMRGGAALEMWHKGNLSDPEEPQDEDQPAASKSTSTVAMPTGKGKGAKKGEAAVTKAEAPVVETKAAVVKAEAPAAETPPAEIGEINFLRAKFKALRVATPSDVLVEAGCEHLNPDTLDGLTKVEFKLIKDALRAIA